jgi:hypothetical protein
MYSPLHGNSTLKVRQYKPGPVVLPVLLLLVVLGSGLLHVGLASLPVPLLLLFMASTVWRRELRTAALVAAADEPVISAVRCLCTWPPPLLLCREPLACEPPEPVLDAVGVLLLRAFLLAAAALCFLLGLGLLLRPCLLPLLLPLPEAPLPLVLLLQLVQLLPSWPTPAVTLSP